MNSIDLTHFPFKPGVYIMKNDRNEIIYIGKALSLKKRVSSYFSGLNKDPKTTVLVQHIHSIEFITTNSEVEALILENNLIKKHQPHYNINLKDNKTYPHILVTNDLYPRLIVTRKRGSSKGRYLGPYTNAKMIRKHLKILQKIFPYRTCKKNLAGKKIPNPCLNYHIGLCSGACQGTISPEEYKQKIIEPIVMYFKGRYKDLEKELQSRMQKASKDLKYEEAASYRDQLKIVREIVEKQRVYLDEQTDCDVFGYFQTGIYRFLVILFLREGKILGKVSYSYDKEEEPEVVLQQAMQNFYAQNQEIPPEIILPFHPDVEEPLVDYIGQLRKAPVKFSFPKSGSKADLIKLACDNAQFTFQETKKVTQKELVLIELKTALGLPNEPRRIEAFDVSNTEGKLSVTAMVCFTNGIPDKKHYRMYKIRSKDTPDDYAMLMEGTFRHYKRMIDEKLPQPDLILIDGGKGQLSSVYKVIQSLQISVPIISLAKKEEEIFFPNQSEPLVLSRHTNALKLLQEVRDEVHRYGITFHRRLRSKRMVRSKLDEIFGIGAVRKKALLQHFHSLKAIEKATLEELKSLPKMDKTSAEAVYSFFHPDFQSESSE